MQCNVLYTNDCFQYDCIVKRFINDEMCKKLNILALNSYDWVSRMRHVVSAAVKRSTYSSSWWGSPPLLTLNIPRKSRVNSVYKTLPSQLVRFSKLTSCKVERMKLFRFKKNVVTIALLYWMCDRMKNGVFELSTSSILLFIFHKFINTI